METGHSDGAETDKGGNGSVKGSHASWRLRRLRSRNPSAEF